MAKGQKSLDGFPEPGDDVLALAETYVSLYHHRSATQQKEDLARDALITAMNAEGLTELDLDCYELRLKHTESDKIKVKKLGEPEGEEEG
jgi:hypothetical protein